MKFVAIDSAESNSAHYAPQHTQVILDCTELRWQTQSDSLIPSEMYFSYKSHCTVKALFDIATVTFISDLYGGSLSDKELSKQSCIAERLTWH